MSTGILVYLVYLLLFVAIFLLALQLYPEAGPTVEGEVLPGGFYRVARPFIKSLSAFNAKLKLPQVKERYRRQLELAGLFYDISPDDFLAIKELVTLLFGGLGVMGYFYAWPDPLIIVAGFVLGFLLPDLQLSDLTKKRQRMILRALPDFLDLLTLSVEAGLDMVGAMRKVVERSAPGPLTTEFKLYLKELMVGVSRREALLNMARKLDVPDFNSFVTAVAQAEEAGGSLGKILRIQAEDMRRKRFQRAEELAGKAPVKLIFPMMAFIFPATFIMLFGPLVFQFMASGGM